MSTALLVGADRTAHTDTMIGKMACLHWHKFVHSGNKKSKDEMVVLPRPGESLCRNVDSSILSSDPRQTVTSVSACAGGTSPASLGFQLALSLHREMEHLRAGSEAPWPVGALGRKGGQPLLSRSPLVGR